MNRLQSIGKDIWLCEGGNVDFYGFAYSTRMVIVRLPDGKLSPCALSVFRNITAASQTRCAGSLESSV